MFDRTCAKRHIGGSGTDNNNGILHWLVAALVLTEVYAARMVQSATHSRPPLRALWQHPPYFHDGSAATLADVVAHYNRVVRSVSPQSSSETSLST